MAAYVKHVYMYLSGYGFNCLLAHNYGILFKNPGSAIECTCSQLPYYIYIYMGSYIVLKCSKFICCRHTCISHILDKSHSLKELQQDFLKIKDATRNGVIQKCGNETRDLVNKIMNLPAPLRDESDELFLNERADSIVQSPTTDIVFYRIGFHWDYLNPDVYYHLIIEYSLRDLLEPLEEYRVKLDKFSEQINLQEFCEMDGPKGSLAPPPGFAKLTTKHDWNPQTTPSKKAIEYQKNSASQYGVRKCAVWLVKFGKGCVRITLLVPESIIQVIETTTPDFSRHMALYTWNLKRDVCIIGNR